MPNTQKIKPQPDYKRSLVIRHMDRLMSRLVGWRDGYRCFVCGAVGCDAHHYGYSRSILHYRWHLHNVVFLCRKCHQKAELDNSKALIELIRVKKPEMYAWYEKRRPDSEIAPIPLNGLFFIYDSLQRLARDMGVPPEITLDVAQEKGELPIPDESSPCGPARGEEVLRANPE